MATNGADNTARTSEHSQGNQAPESMKALETSHEKLANRNLLPNTSDATLKAWDLTSRILDFLSNASNETLGACVVALGATTWLILGRVGLVIIGLIGGIVLHATWEGSGQGSANDEAGALEARKRREKSLDVVGRVLDWRERTRGEKEPEVLEQNSQKTLDFTDFQPETGAALTTLTDAVIRDYVK